MHLTDLLSAERVSIHRAPHDSLASTPQVHPFDKAAAIAELAALLSRDPVELTPEARIQGGRLEKEEIERVLLERERLQSTGIGEGVAIPHGALSQLSSQVAALLIVPDGLEFAAIDERKVNILFAVVGPKRATGEHLKTLARVSRLLRNQGFRDRLIMSDGPRAAYELIVNEETGGEPR